MTKSGDWDQIFMSVIVSHLLVKSDLAGVYAEYSKYIYFHRLFKAEVLVKERSGREYRITNGNWSCENAIDE